jgi:hypothetical protein
MGVQHIKEGRKEGKPTKAGWKEKTKTQRMQQQGSR